MQDNTKLFDFIYETVNNEGGDGDLALVLTAQDHRIVADQFELYLKNNSVVGWGRQTVDDGDIIFFHDQETFIFSNRDHFCCWTDIRNNPEHASGRVPCTNKVIVHCY